MAPTLTIPLTSNGLRRKNKLEDQYWYILPENLNVAGKIDPETLKENLQSRSFI